MKDFNSPSSPTKQIDFFELIAKIWKHRLLYIAVCAVTGIIGIIVAFSIPKEFNSQVVLAPEASEGGIEGAASSLAGMFGMNLKSMGEEAISIEIYPEILRSSLFIQEILEIPITMSDGQKIDSYRNYLYTQEKMPWWSLISYKVRLFFKNLRGPKKQESGTPLDPSKVLSEEEVLLIEAVGKNITCDINKENALITISANAQDPLACAILVDSVQSKLQKYITAYKTKKARIDVAYYEKLLAESKKNYQAAQKKYSDFTDSHYGTIMTSYKSKESFLENEMQLQYSVYSQLAQQLQLAQAKVQECTPAYVIIQPSIKPIKPVAPKKTIIVIAYTILGFLLASAYIFGKDYLKKDKQGSK